MSKYTQQFSKEEVREYNDNIVKGLLEDFKTELQNMYQSDRYVAWLNTAALFPNYSLNNQISILLQRPDATRVCAAGAWHKMERSINKGAKSIKILAPMPYKLYVKEPKLDEHGEKMYGPDGKELTETKTIQQMWFKPVSVFDISDTNGKPLPELGIDELKGSVDQFPVLLDALKRISPVPVTFEPITDGSKGFFSPSTQRIVVKRDMDEIATIKTLVHEISHSLLHDKENGSRIDGLDETKASRNDKEMQAESVAYIVCKRLGLDTSDYSVGYVAGWGQDPDLKQFAKSLETINKTASEIIKKLDEIVPEIMQEKSLEHEELSPYKLSFTVSECVEFPNMGASYTFDNIADALKQYQSMPSSSMIKGLTMTLQTSDGSKPSCIEYTLARNNRFCDDVFDYVKDKIDVSDISQTILTVQMELADEVALRTKDGFLEVHETDGGYDYTFYNSNYKLVDGGVYETDSMKQTMKELAEEYGPGIPMSYYVLEKLISCFELTPYQENILKKHENEKTLIQNSQSLVK